MAVSVGTAHALGDIKFEETTQYFVGTTRHAMMRTLSAHDGWHLSSEREQALKQVFVGDQGYLDGLLSDLRRRRVLVLAGEPDCGKTTTAVYLGSLLETGDQRRPTWVIPPLDVTVRVNLHEFVFDHAEAVGRLVIFADVFARGNRDLESWFQRMDRLAWDGMSERLRARGAYLVFTASATSLDVCRQRLLEHKVHRELVPLSRELLESAFDKHLRLHEDTAVESVGKIAELRSQRERIVTELNRVPPLVRFLDFYVLHGGPDLSLDAGLQRFRGTASVTLRQLAPHPDAWAFVVALGAAHGASNGEGVPWVYFERLRQVIATVITREWPRKPIEAEAEPLVDRFAVRTPDDAFLQACEAEIVRDSVAAADIIRFRRDEHAEEIWATLLRQHRRLLLALVEPLRRLAEDPQEVDIGLRDFAGRVLGRLGELDSRRVFDRLVTQWTSNTDRACRVLVGAVYEGALRSRDVRYREVCLANLTRYWQRDEVGNDVDRKDRILTTLATCARIGAVDLPAAMNILGEIAAERVAPAHYDAQRLTRLLSEVENDIKDAPSSEHSQGMLVYQTLLRGLTYRLYSQQGSTVAGMQRALTSLSFARDPIAVIDLLRGWIASGRPGLGLLVALLFLQDGGLASRLRKAGAAPGGDHLAQPGDNLILLSLSATREAVLTMALFLADIYDSFAETFTVPLQSQRYFRESLADHLRGWIEDAVHGGTGRAAMLQLLTALSSVRQRRLFELVHQVLGHDSILADPDLRDFAEAVRYQQML